MEQTIVNEIIDTIVNVWEKDISNDYNKGILLEEDTLKCALYFHLRNKLGKLMNDNNLCILTEYLGPEFKRLNCRPDMVIAKMKDNCVEKYLINHIEEIVVVIELKFKDKYSTGPIIDDKFKIKNYIKSIDSNTQYVLVVIQEKYWEYPFWLDNRQVNNWAKGRVTELVANCDIDDNMIFKSSLY